MSSSDGSGLPEGWLCSTTERRPVADGGFEDLTRMDQACVRRSNGDRRDNNDLLRVSSRGLKCSLALSAIDARPL
jgi:hypothetical protein